MRSKRPLVVAALVFALLVTALAVVARPKPKVTVRTGERVYCVYGELVSSDVRNVEVSAKEANRYSVKQRTILCDKHRRLSELYDVAQEALKRGDAKTAQKVLTTLLAEDPNFRRASSQLDELRKGKTPPPDTSPEPTPGSGGSGGGSGGTTEPQKPQPKPEGPIASMLGYVPDTIEGFRAQAIVAEEFALTRQYDPIDRSRILQLVIVGEQYRNKATAESALSRYKRTYSKDGETISIGSRSVYVGTNGSSLAGLTFRDGTVVVIMEMAVSSENPASIKGDLRDVAEFVLK